MIRSRNLAPFIHTEMTAPYIYLTHIVALLPCVIAGIIFYGITAITLIAVCATAFMLLDNAFGRMVRRDGIDRNYADFSSIEAGVIFALMLPPGTSIIIALTGVLFGSFVVKQFFGGAGNNILNPACVARLFVEMVFPSQMECFKTPFTSWFDITTLIGNTDNVVAKDDVSTLYLIELIAGSYTSYIGMTCAGLIIIAGIYQVFKGTVRMYAPLSYLIVLMIIYPIKGGSFNSVIPFILFSGALFVAVYVLGDFTTMPSRNMGGVIAGAICAVLTVILIGRVSDMCALLAPVMAINFLSFEIDFFTKAIAHRKTTRQREVEL